MPLSEKRRSQLDGIVSQMEANGENEEDIRFVVNDFKGKYEGEDLQLRKQPEWYDVPGKLQNTIQNTSNKIQREGELTGTGQQGNIAGGTWSIGHAVAGTIKGVTDILSPVFNNPVTKAIVEGAAYAGGGHENRVRKSIENRQDWQSPEPEKSALEYGPVKKTMQYFQEHPELGNRFDTSLEIAGVIPFGEAAAGVKQGFKTVAGDALQGAGKRIQNVTAKISAKGAREGAKIETIPKYNLWGNATEVSEKAKNLITEKAQQLKQIVKEAADDPINNTDILDLIARSEDDVLQNTSYGRDKIRRVYDNALNDIIDRYGDGALSMDLADAQMLKRETGKYGDWVEYAGKRSGNPDANIEATVYNDLYNKLKVSIENKGGPQVKKLNQELSELIPLERDMSRRSLVEKRNEIIPLKDYIGLATAVGTGSPIPLTIVAAQHASKSPTIGKMLYKAGEQLKRPGKVAQKETTIQDILRQHETPPLVGNRITDENRLLPYQMVGKQTQPISSMEIPIGAKIRGEGVPIYRDLYPDQLKLPSPEDIQAAYPHLSVEDVRNPIAPFNDRRALPAPMVGESDIPFSIEKQIPTMRQRYEAIGVDKKHSKKHVKKHTIGDVLKGGN